MTWRFPHQQICTVSGAVDAVDNGSGTISAINQQMGRNQKMVKRRMTFAAFISLATLMVIQLTLTAVPCRAGMQEDVDRAVNIFDRFKDMPETSIPPAVMRNAKGLAILTVIKAGFIVSGRGGSGIVIARTGKGWSGPSAIGTGGAGFGFQIGGQVTEFVIVLNTVGAVQAFSQGGNVSLGGDLSVSAGPVGRTAEAGIMPTAAVYSYSRSQGLFAGASLEGTVIATRDDANSGYYGKPVTPSQILSGAIKPPKSAVKLQRVLSRY
jgi:lipid-binding SYLF domain-containing protein